MAKKKSELLAHEDWQAIWIGFALIIIGVAVYFSSAPPKMDEQIASINQKMEKESEAAPFKTVEWFLLNDEKEDIQATKQPVGKFLKKLLSKPQKWSENPLDAFFMGEDKAQAKAAAAREKYLEANAAAEKALSKARIAQIGAEREDFINKSLNAAAANQIEQWRQTHRAASAAKKKANVKPHSQIIYLLPLALILGGLFGVGIKLMGGNLCKFFSGFLFVFLLAVISYVFAGQSVMKEFGLGYALWAILIGLIVSNTIGAPNWVKPAIQTEFYIKTGLVLLGAEVLFGKIVQIGVPGLMVAWIVTPIVILTSYWFGKKFIKMESDELNITMSSAVSVCGVSAAIATAAACKAKKEELTLAVGLSLIFTAIMMVLMPAFIKAVAMTEILGGAWMGGVIDSTGAVAAAGAFLGEKALYVAATIKMIQNILIGVVAFVVAVYWAMKKGAKAGTKPDAMEIWRRFPKFVIGFAAASIVISILSSIIGSDYSYVLIDHGVIGGFTKNFRGWMFCLAFASIGLSTNFRELSSYFKGGKPFTLYIFGQTFNLLLTLLVAWIAFYIVFPEITKGI